MKKCRIGIIGAGRIGKLHAENICFRLPQFELIGIAEPSPDLAWTKSISLPLLTSSADEIIHHPTIDAIIIASPSTEHMTQVIAGCEAGKAIFCEKPLALTEIEIITIMDYVQKHQTLLQVGFNRRFDNQFKHLRTRIEAGDIGTPQVLRITSRDPACPPKAYCQTSGGLFMDMAIHDFDMARFISGHDVTEVYATGSALINPELSECDDIDTVTNDVGRH